MCVSSKIKNNAKKKIYLVDKRISVKLAKCKKSK